MYFKLARTLPVRWLMVLSTAALWHSSTNATLKDDIGFTELSSLLGASLPSGSGVPVFQVEATDAAGNWAPDATNSEFAGKSIVALGLPASVGASSHATTVAKNFYGNGTSISPSISDIGAHSASTWLFQHLVPAGKDPGERRAIPLETNRRIANHSWVGGGINDSSGNFSPTGTSTFLRLADWVSDVDELIQIYGIQNNATDNPFFATALNGIVAGVTDATHADGVIALDSIYVAGRPSIHIVTPMSYTSDSVGIVSSAIALLIEAAQQNPAWSDASTTNRSNNLIQNAERIETIKAALMAGASRVTNNTTSATQGDIDEYRVLPTNQTDNGLDWRYGAGQLNIHRSYQILAAGEAASIEDGGSLNSGYMGFDHDNQFGGSGGSNITATYDLGVIDHPSELGVALVWNLAVTGTANSSLFFDESAVLHNLDLELIDVTNGNQVIADSTSTINNTENIWFPLQANTHYQLRVTRASGQSDFDWDYSLAWAEVPTDVPVIIDTNIPFPLWALAILGLGLGYIQKRQAIFATSKRR